MKKDSLHHFLTLVDDWRHEYHTDKLGEIIFQNERLLSNVVFNQKSFNTIHNHPAGAENLPDTISNPDEVWSSWVNPSEQKSVNRVYIKDNYCVWTTDGLITDARQMLDVNSARKGVLI